jgi:demethylmenaquinone methyltransferase/2-methoxy-6-polyprenyl-1,4-benzoquinol methylase
LTFREINRVTKLNSRVVALELTRPSFLPAKVLHYLVVSLIAPWIGKVIAGNREAYTYLPQSIAGFLSPEEVKAVMEEAGLQQVEISRLSLGMATVHVAIKQS